MLPQDRSDRNRFIVEKRALWEELLALTSQRGPLSPEKLLRVGTLYRAASADLAKARSLFPADPLIGDLEDLVGNCRRIVYRRVPRSFSLVGFYRRRYWQLIRERPWPLALSVAIMVISTVAVLLWTIRDPGRASTLLGSRLGGGKESFGDQGLSAAQQTSMATSIFLNNIRVSFFVFALGVTLGIGSALLMMFNGALLGLVAGLAIHAGHGDVAFTLIYAHGFLELTIIVVSSAAGMRIGWAVVDPGYRTRATAIRDEALKGVEIIVGTIPLFVLAGLIEGFFTPAGFGPVWAGLVGTFFGAGYWALLLYRGRPRQHCRSEAT